MGLLVGITGHSGQDYWSELLVTLVGITGRDNLVGITRDRANKRLFGHCVYICTTQQSDDYSAFLETCCLLLIYY